MDFEFVSDIKGGSIPKEYIPGVLKGIESVLGAGVVAGYPVLGMKATLIDGAYHDVDSSVMAFEIAGRAADAHVLLNNERTALIHTAHHIHVHAAHTPHLQAIQCGIELGQQRR